MSNVTKRRALVVHGLSAVSAVAMSAALMVPPAYSAADPSSVFIEEGFNWCDAVLIGAYWGMGPSEAKAGAGQKIIDRGKDGKKSVKQIIKEGRKQAACQWEDTGHSFEEAELLGAFWSVSTGDAKAKVARLYTAGDSDKVVKAIKKARKGA